MADAAEQIRQAEAYKDEGNRLYSEQSYKRALGAYHKVFCYVNGLQVPPDSTSSSDKGATGSGYIPKERVDDVKKLKQSTRLNMAACYLKLGEHHKCVEACTAALEFGVNAKAYFRRGQAHAELRNFAGAKADLERVRDLEPDNGAVAVELRKLRTSASRADAKERQQYAKLFGDTAASDTSAAAGYAAAEEVPVAAASSSAVEGAAEEVPVAATSSSAVEGEEGGVNADASVLAPATTPAAPCAKQSPAPASVVPVVAPMSCDGSGPPDEARKLDVAVRELKYSWQQSDDDVKIYVSFDQSSELEGGVDDSRVKVEFGEWSVLLVIDSLETGRTPLGLRLGDFHRRIAPDKCRCTVRSNRITLKLVKQVKEHWWNLLQSIPLSAG
eukprot:TRINITY_DN4429_c0_g1_i1.p1 TRINITY_DN4429_c0_g1~~TRINITY_DN4429_c0_g1_i1.p1  ORF type:complete len:386 (-),score=84.16 TRINITY_DN4429_c0_g1_i1:219-1376(-)